MMINPSTTIVDLAFNLSGSLAGIPAALSQLPVGERVGFDTLPDVWEDVDDTGQTWTPDLDGVEVDITVEAYNPTAIQKAPYSTDMKCIDVAEGWGNTLLEVLIDDSWVRLEDINSGDRVTNTEIRIFNPPITTLYTPSPVSEKPTSAISFPIYEVEDSPTELEFAFRLTSQRFIFIVRDTNNDYTYMRYALTDYEIVENTFVKASAISTYETIWRVTDASTGKITSDTYYTQADVISAPLPFNLTFGSRGDGYGMLSAVNDHIWSFGKCIFVKLTK